MPRRPRSSRFLMMCVHRVSCAALVAVLSGLGSDLCDFGFGFTDLCKMEGSSYGGYASVDAVDCRDSERRQHSAVMHGLESSVDLYLWYLVCIYVMYS